MYSAFQNDRLPYPYHYCGFCHDFHFIGYFLNHETHTLKLNCVQNTSHNSHFPFSVYPVSPISLPTDDMQKHLHFLRYSTFPRFKIDSNDLRRSRSCEKAEFCASETVAACIAERNSLPIRRIPVILGFSCHSIRILSTMSIDVDLFVSSKIEFLAEFEANPTFQCIKNQQKTAILRLF